MLEKDPMQSLIIVSAVLFVASLLHSEVVKSITGIIPLGCFVGK